MSRNNSSARSKNKAAASIPTKLHWEYFSEFCFLEVASGGPDPQITLVGEMSKEENFLEKLWRGGCYVCVYNVPFAEVLWQHWPWPRILEEKKELLMWIKSNWEGIKTRQERKSVRIPENMEKFLLDYADCMTSSGLKRLFEEESLTPEKLYLKAFEDCQIVKFMGRYVALKLVEYYRKYCGLNVRTADIRPKGAWSPRTTLGVLWPEKLKALVSDDRPDTLQLVNGVVEDTLSRLKEEFGITIDKFQLQVMLCEYRESYEGMRQYPGRSHDSELGYWSKAKSYWGSEYSDYSNMLDVRKRVFPNQHLGEIQGWDGARNDCGAVLATYGYTWSDLLYDYNASKENLSDPIERPL